MLDDARLPTGTGERRPWWAVGGLAAIAALSLCLYLWALSRNGMANSYYAAAVKSASVSWKAFFFGSLDPGSFITIDKPPFSIWVMALFARVFGFSSWSMLVPQALAGTASVLVLYRLVRRWAGDVAGLLAALCLALTPVAVVIFRYNNPDAFLTLLLLLAAWGVWSAIESGSTLKLSLAGVALGFAFLTKMLMAFMVLPAFALTHLLLGPPRFGKRLLQLLAALGAMALSGGWWLAIVESWPVQSRPYVGGTIGNSWIDLVFSRTGGYLTSGAASAVSTTQMSGDAGWLRIFNEALGGQVAWFIPLALTGLVAGLCLTRRAARTDKLRAGYALWGLWTVVMVVIFSYVEGTFHPYYTVVLTPGVAALAGGGCVALWGLGRRRKGFIWLLPLVIGGTAVWSALLLMRTSGYAPGLATAVIVLGAMAAFATLLLLLRPAEARKRRGLEWGVAAVCIVALLAGPFAFDLSSVRRSMNGNNAFAGPIASGSLGSSADDLSMDEGLVAYLEQHRASAEYLVAVQNTSASVPLILAMGEPVMTIGGYKSRDPVPTADQLQALVAAGELHYVLLKDVDVSDSGLSQQDGSADVENVLRAVTEWVVEHGSAIPASEYDGHSIDGTLYYLP